MVCHKPLQASKKKDGGLQFSNAKAKLFYQHGYTMGQLKELDPDYTCIPCGQCLGCRVDYGKEWASRIMHEAEIHEENCFITLTYANEYLPPGGTLVKADFQKFMKRLREYLARTQGTKVRYFVAGEYGESVGQRPHYHAIIFGWEPKDKRPVFRGRKEPNYVSEVIEKFWPYGMHDVGTVTAKSAGYVASYVLKKVKGKLAREHYGGRQPEYACMSRDGAIGKQWILNNMKDVFNKHTDFIVVDTKKFKIPRIYNKIYSDLFPEKYLEIKEKRELKAYKINKDTTVKRLDDKDKNLKSALSIKSKRLHSKVA